MSIRSRQPRRLPFYNQKASMNGMAEFTPDGQKIVFLLDSVRKYAQIYSCSLDGSGLERITYTQSIEVEPTVNPKIRHEIAFVSDRSGMPQVYRMNLNGTDVARLIDGEGEAVNPSWHPDGQLIAFSWTKGYDPGNYNVL